jgi:hypothetical protein
MLPTRAVNGEPVDAKVNRLPAALIAKLLKV